jgi:SWI/SNF-related matrix-associated actin-dependent regulator of chromatin subfamily A-like protein 1
LLEFENLKSIQALGLLNKYEGKNPYLKKLQYKQLKSGINLTDTQAQYIIDYHDKDPILVNRVITITEYFGEELQKQHGLSFVPQRVLFQFILAETNNAYHVYGKLKRNQNESSMYWIPKTQVLDDPYWEEPNIEVDFDKYAKMDKLGRKPYAHQETGIKFLLSRDGCILADDMGLGKTFMATVAALESGAKKILIVCPSSLKINWEREINCFDPNTSIISSSNWNPNKFTIINYEILKNFHTPKDKRTKEDEAANLVMNQLKDYGFDLVIVDEAHNLKNHKSVRGKIMTELAVDYGIDKVWLLTGTPVANRPMDFYNLLKLIKSPIVNNFRHYALRYCDGKTFWKRLKNGKKRQIWLTDGASNLDELSQKTRNIILRRKKEDVLDMPEKTISTIYHELTAGETLDYENLWEEYLLERKAKKKRGAVERDLVELGLLRQFIAKQTIKKTIEMVDNAIEQGEKVIIFTNYNDEQDELFEYYRKIGVRHNGSMNGTAKQMSVDNFQNDPNVKVFIGNIKSAGVGITLTAASTVVFNSIDWVPGNVLQAIDRAYRIGQVNNVSVYFNIFKDTIDERVWLSLFNKTNIIEAILNGKDDNIFTSEEDDDYIDAINQIIDEDI